MKRIEVEKSEIPSWVKPLLWFKRATYSETEQNDGYILRLKWKRLFGTVYLMGSRRFIAPPVHFNCRCDTTPNENYFCGNCHGTGQSDFGLGASWGEECDACDGKGYVKIDPNAKSMSWEDLKNLGDNQ